MNKYLFLTLLFLFPLYVSGDTNTVPFSDVWEKIKSESHALKATVMEKQAAKISKERASRHWLPRIYTDVRSMTTNDPATNFFMKLGQRSANESDFSTRSMRSRVSNFIDTNNNPYTNINTNTMNLLAPDTLNNPGTNTYQKGSLGVDIALYEGGSKTAIAKAEEINLKAIEEKQKFTEIHEYTEAVSIYGQLQISNRFAIKINSMKEELTSLIKSYQLGARSNPVGYSGLLGLKALKNRIEGMEIENNARIQSLKDNLESATGGLPANWAVENKSTSEYIEAYLKTKTEIDSNNIEPSYRVKAMKNQAKAIDTKADAEQARFLPKVGLFGEGNAYRGDRATAMSYNVGFYAQMNLYSPEEYGAYEQAKLNGKAVKEQAENLKKEEEVVIKKLFQMNNALNKNWDLLIESEKLMDEQLKTAKQLFSSGSINLIQLTEVLSRKTDLIVDMARVESDMIQIKSGIYSLTTENNSKEEAK